ncbi:MAG: hypothetical protein LLF75_10635, partial [Eubacteriales bacterium]|nr:hypothetical protein [Eubacteriales bacterium]
PAPPASTQRRSAPLCNYSSSFCPPFPFSQFIIFYLFRWTTFSGSRSDALAQVITNVYDWRLYSKAFEKLTDQTILARIANTEGSKTGYVRIEAADKLDDLDLAQSIYADVAKNCLNVMVRMRATERLHDQKEKQTLVEKNRVDFVINSHEWRECESEFAQVSEQTAFAAIAINAKDRLVAEKAIEKLYDQTLLAEVIIKHTKSSDVQYAALCKLNDQALLAAVIGSIGSEHARMEVVNKLTVQSVLADIAKFDSNTKVRSTAVEKLTDQAALTEIVKMEKHNGFVCLSAAERLADRSVAQEAFAYIAKQDFYPENMRYVHSGSEPLLDAVKNLDDRALLVDVAHNAKSTEVRIKAMEKAGLICKKDEHKWIKTGTCLKKCAVCGIGLYDHDYKEVSSEDTGEVSLSTYECTKCGQSGWASGYGSELQDGYCILDV